MKMSSGHHGNTIGECIMADLGKAEAKLKTYPPDALN
jgi:hypothetical protein